MNGIERLKKPNPDVPRVGRITLRSTRDVVDKIVERMRAACMSHRATDHGYGKAIYVTSPDVLYIELAEETRDI